MADDREYVVEFQPNPTQKAFITSQAKADYFSSRVREGKSAALSWSSLYHVQHNPGAKWVFIRDTWENLRRTTLAEFFKWFPPGIMGDWKVSDKSWTWAEGVGKGSILWLGMDDPNDAGKLQSLELAGAAIDEMAPAEGSGGIPSLVFDLLLTRMNQTSVNWRTIKCASNNPDETHWSYERFVNPGTEGFKLWQPVAPENERNLPDGYYGELRKLLQHRPDLIARFIDGKFGFQQIGRAVTPQWNDDIHLATGLIPMKGRELVLCWDFGLNPTCIITQPTALGHWLILEAIIGDGIGVQELIEEVVKPTLTQRYAGFRWRHIGDPNGAMREQSSSRRSAVRVLRAELGGIFRAGPSSLSERIEPLRAVLARTLGGIGVVRVDRVRAKAIWAALRGGWHFAERTEGVISPDPVKDIHSHPGDALGYAAARLFPMGRVLKDSRLAAPPRATFFGGSGSSRAPKVIAPTGDQIGSYGHSNR
jgi:hypothetical protein